MIDRDDVSVKNTTWSIEMMCLSKTQVTQHDRSIEMMCLSKTQHDVAYVSARVEGRRVVPGRV